MPREVTAELLDQLLTDLSRCFRHPARLYLVGGTSLLLTEIKSSTLDVDLDFTVDPNHHDEWIDCVRHTSRNLGIPVEHASPAHFIPLPIAASERHRFIKRYGQIELFHFDFYAVALSKLHRGNQKDFADVLAMVETKLIEPSQLRNEFEEVLRAIKNRDFSTAPDAFQRNFALFERQLREP